MKWVIIELYSNMAKRYIYAGIVFFIITSIHFIR